MNDSTQYFIDTHCHLDFSRIGKIETVLAQSTDVGVNQFIVPSVDGSNWQKTLDLSSKFANIHCGLGVHPHFLKDDNQLQQLTELATVHRENIVAIGEIGLDGVIDSPQHIQVDVLTQQLALAKMLELPVICHGHKALDILLKYLRLYQLPKGGVIHGFSGSIIQASEFIKLGFYIGIGGVITYERAQKTRRTVAQLPLEALLLETDSPDMPVNGFQGQVNFPKRIPIIAQHLSDLHNTSVDFIAEITTTNAKQLFEI